ncbi:hypothetical protein [Salmonella enterica]|uniref:hypothetical protein n=1 Tax=Salmonella enterica TaxID=28901 RepID=UPI001FD4CBCC|nr:hypothetical protein [Salmonella enterica]
MQFFTSSDTVMLCAKTCDRCGRHAKTVVDDIEFNEFLSVNHLAGYGSIFGDSNRLKTGFMPTLPERRPGPVDYGL